MNKEQARYFFSQKRNQLSDEEIEYKSLEICTQLIQSGFAEYHSFHIFLSISGKKEVNTLPIIKILQKNNKLLYCPKVKGDYLIHYLLTPETKLKTNTWGIPEPYEENPVIPHSIDCIFIPLLAYDMQGNRVGYGKGYYDRFLSKYPQSKKIGLSLFHPTEVIENVSDSDITLDYIITPGYFSGFPMEEK